MPIVDQLPYTPWLQRGSVVDGAFVWRLGIHPLDPRDWIELGNDALGSEGWIAEKSRVLAEQHRTAFAVLDGIERESQEIADEIVRHLRARWPDRFGAVKLADDVHPLEAASRLVPEDLVLMVERDGRLIFGGGSVCFPNRWDLRPKLGRTMAEVHAPVAHLNDQLEAGIDAFLSRLTPERSFWRLGWGIIDVPDGYTPLDGTAGRRPLDPTTAELFVRVERETLRRFPATNCVLFTIRTYITPLASVMVEPESAAAIALAVDAMDDEVREYKELSQRGGSLVDDLRSQLM